MKPVLWSILLAASAAAGCVTSPISWPPDKAPPASNPARGRVSTVRPEQVNEANARKAAEALQAEMDADNAPPAPAAGDPKAPRP